MKKFANLCFEFSFDQVSPHFRHTAGIHWKHLFCFVSPPLSIGNYRKSLWVSLQQESSSSSSEVKNQKLLFTLVLMLDKQPARAAGLNARTRFHQTDQENAEVGDHVYHEVKAELKNLSSVLNEDLNKQDSGFWTIAQGDGRWRIRDFQPTFMQQQVSRNFTKLPWTSKFPRWSSFQTLC